MPGGSVPVAFALRSAICNNASAAGRKALSSDKAL